MNDKPLPKSLHTVTVLVNLARFHQICETCSKEESINWALKRLGYDPANDPYDLAGAALRQLS